MSVKVAWAKHLYNAYNSIKAGDSVYDTNEDLLGKADGCYTRPTAKSPGCVCLVRKGKFIWICGDVEKHRDKWKVQEDTNIHK